MKKCPRVETPWGLMALAFALALIVVFFAEWAWFKLSHWWFS